MEKLSDFLYYAIVFCFLVVIIGGFSALFVRDSHGKDFNLKFNFGNGTLYLGKERSFGDHRYYRNVYRRCNRHDALREARHYGIYNPRVIRVNNRNIIVRGYDRLSNRTVKIRIKRKTCRVF